MIDGDARHSGPISHVKGRARDMEIAKVGELYGWTWVALPDRRRAMPIAMLRACGFEFAAEELSKDRECCTSDTHAR